MMPDSEADMLEAVASANRVLLAAWGAHPPDRRKAWQAQAGLYVLPGYAPSGAWGQWAYVRSYRPECGELTLRAWAPEWREAIEAVLAEALML